MANLKTKVYFGGFELTEDFLAVDVSRPYPAHDVETREVSGRDGAMIVESRLEPIEIGMTLVCKYNERHRRREAMRRLMEALDVDSPARLEFSDDMGLWYEAVPNGGGDRASWFMAEGVELGFLVPDPVMWGESRKVAVPSGGTVSVRVGGTRPARPVISATGAARSSGNVWGVTDVTTGAFTRVSLGASTHTVEIDCEEHTCRVDGALRAATLTSDYLALSPGVHSLRMDGTASGATIEFVERWL